jgi:hypothetical protein
VLRNLFCALVAAFASLFAVAEVSAAPHSGIVISSDVGDWVGDGKLYYDTNGVWESTVQSSRADGAPDLIRLIYRPTTSDNWQFIFSTDRIGRPIGPGVYEKATRAILGSNATPGIDVAGYARGCNVIEGRFEIFEIAFEGSGANRHVSRLALHFEQHCERFQPLCSGTIFINSSLAHFPLNVTPAQNIVPNTGALVEHRVIVNPLDDVASPVTLSARIDPPAAGIHVTFAPESVRPGETSVMNIAVDPGTPNKVYRMTIAGSSGGLHDETSLPFEVRGTTGVEMVAEPNAWIGDGRNVSRGFDHVWYAGAGSDRSDGKVDFVSVRFTDSPAQFWDLNFTTSALGVPLEPGEYADARHFDRYPDPGEAGHPGINVSGDMHGCFALHGRFRVLEADFDYTYPEPRVIRLAIEFEFSCDPDTATTYGVVYYNSNIRDVVLRAADDTLPVAFGGTNRTEIEVDRHDGATEPVEWSFVVVPDQDDVAVSLVPAGDVATLSVNAAKPAQRGGRLVWVTAHTGDFERRTLVRAQILQAHFTLVAPEGNIHIAAGSTLDFVVGVDRSSGYRGPVSLYATGPAGTKIKLRPGNVVTRGDSATFRLKVPADTPPGVYYGGGVSGRAGKGTFQWASSVSLTIIVDPAASDSAAAERE